MFCSVYSVFVILFCVLYYCHRVSTQFQLSNISYHIVLSRRVCECCWFRVTSGWFPSPHNVILKYPYWALTNIIWEVILADISCPEVSCTELAGCLPPFCPETFVLTFAVRMYKRQNVHSSNSACCCVWVWNLVSRTEGRTYAECVREQGADRDIWA